MVDSCFIIFDYRSRKTPTTVIGKEFPTFKISTTVLPVPTFEEPTVTCTSLLVVPSLLAYHRHLHLAPFSGELCHASNNVATTDLPPPSQPIAFQKESLGILCWSNHHGEGEWRRAKEVFKITYHDKATQTETEEEDTIEKILQAITTLCTKVDSMDNEIQKLKTNEDNLKSKASQQHDYKNAELRRSEDGKKPELKGDDGKLLKTHNVCLNTAAGEAKRCLTVDPTNSITSWDDLAKMFLARFFPSGKGAKLRSEILDFR
ncbi:hypothetical protein MTR67_003256 [Solanum verrucosum]|uniref:Retrotransposon gag domain-containing protein n=1 Tax=Solanum verrucosum TaxID=315347 RepID=A0AAF0PSC9_SOLVR|nr:hypothetical protein MTR67_003256 [Solanum verrucosum]